MSRPVIAGQTQDQQRETAACPGSVPVRDDLQAERPESQSELAEREGKRYDTEALRRQHLRAARYWQPRSRRRRRRSRRPTAANRT